MTKQKTQLVVLGAGPGGYAAAFFAADQGMQVTLIDEAKNPGGVCLYRGCIPSKALLHVSKLIRETQEAKHWGVEFEPPKINLDQLRNWKEQVVQKLTGGLGVLSTQRKINAIQGRAQLTGSNSLNVETSDGMIEVEYDHVILATGSRPIVIPGLFPDSEKIMDSTAALELNDIPQKLLVVGGGYIGLEMGSVYSGLGSDVSVVEMTSGLLPGADRDMVKFLSDSLEKRFSKIMLNTKVIGVKIQENRVFVQFENLEGEKFEEVYDKLLVSIGRKPNTENLGIENTKTEINEKNFIIVNDRLQTADPSIYAIGDIAGEPMLAHKASHEAKVAVEVILGHKVVFEPKAIPAVVFTDPEIAWCGITETQAKNNKRNVKVVRFPWAASGRATTLDRSDGLTKLIIDPETERILGVGICGPGAGELIAEGALAIEMGANATDLKLTIHPHPTLSETMMEAAEVYFGESTHLYRPKK